MNAEGGAFAGLDRFEARKAVEAELEGAGPRARSKTHVHASATASAARRVVEPMLSTQWFVKMEPLAEPAIEAVEQGKTKFVPEPLDEDVHPLDEQHPRLVHLAPALVGPPHPGVVLRRSAREIDGRAHDAAPMRASAAPARR